jgi:type I restriction enzyme R subunit
METKDRLMSGRGNAMLVAGSIYEACKLFELFAKTPLKGKCAIVTSYTPNIADTKGEESGEGATETLDKYEIYRQMLADWFNEPPETAVNKAAAFEKAVKKKFIDEPGQMKLLIVVDKLLTGFDAPPATYLYIDKQMRDHGLFQAICRVNRLDGDDKEFGYIVDYKDLFRSVSGAIKDYTAGALDGYDADDVKGLVKDRLAAAKERLDDALEQVELLCEPVHPPKDQAAFFAFFSSEEHGNAEQLAKTEKLRLSLYTKVAALVRAYADLASEMSEAGYSSEEAEAIKKKVAFYEQLRAEVKLHSGDAIDLKLYEPAMRHLIDSYIQAAESRTVSTLDDLSLVELVVARGADAIKDLPSGLKNNPKAAAENNIRKVIINQSGLNPKYYEQMSKLLDALIAERKQGATTYQQYLEKLVAFTKDLHSGPNATKYPATLNTAGKRALFDNLGRDEALALAVDTAVYANLQDGWRTHTLKTGRVRRAIEGVLGDDDQEKAQAILDLIKQHHEY